MDDELLLQYYSDKCEDSAKQQGSIIVAIPHGMGTECVGINVELTQRATLNSASATHSIAINRMFCNSNLTLVPCTGTYHGEEARMQSAERALRSGYARDRVVGLNRVKRNLLNTDKSASDNNILFLTRWFERFESALSNTDVAVPSDALDGAQQSSFIRVVPTEGKTLNHIEAVASDPSMQIPETLTIVHNELKAQVDRDKATLGTETFVSFTFPPPDHEIIVSAAGVNGGIAKGDGSFAFPALVTLHSPTGEAIALASAEAGKPDPNVMVVADAAELLGRIHSLAKLVDRNCVVLEHS